MALDRNDNGLIDDGGELFGNFTEQPLTPRPNGYLALAVFDKNADDFIDNADAIFSRLRLWQDTNHDGASQLNELTTLQQSGISASGLSFEPYRLVDQHGNLFCYGAPIRVAGASRVGRLSYDVFLVNERSESAAIDQDVSKPAYATITQTACVCTLTTRGMRTYRPGEIVQYCGPAYLNPYCAGCIGDNDCVPLCQGDWNVCTISNCQGYAPQCLVPANPPCRVGL